MGKLKLEKNFKNKLENIIKKIEIFISNETKSNNTNPIKYQHVKHSYIPQTHAKKDNDVIKNANNYITELQKNIIINLNYNTFIEFGILGMVIGLGMTLGLKLGDLIIY